MTNLTRHKCLESARKGISPAQLIGKMVMVLMLVGTAQTSLALLAEIDPRPYGRIG